MSLRSSADLVVRRLHGGPIAGALALMIAVSATAGRASAADTETAEAFVAAVQSGDPVDLDGATIVGNVDLRSVDTAHRVIRCANCTFAGDVRMSNVIFERIVDLSGSTIAGDLIADGAIFRDTFLMRRTPQRAASVTGEATFSLAVFAGGSTFEGARFAGTADFRVAQFMGNASFVNVAFAHEAWFDSVIFAGQAQFASTSSGDAPTEAPTSACGRKQGRFDGPASFASAHLGEKADFRQRCFAGPASFVGSTFGAADYTLAEFYADATFDDVSIDGAASFRGVWFHGELWLQNAVLNGPTDFATAVFLGPVEMFGTSASVSLSLRAILPPASLQLEKLRANGLEMDLEHIDLVQGSAVRTAVLGMIEASARARGDLAVANDAAFRRAQAATDVAEGTDRLQRLVDEQIGGYLVQPFYPLRAFLVLLILGSSFRAVYRLSLRARRRGVPATRNAAAASGVASAAGIDPAAAVSVVSGPAHDGLLTASKIVVIASSSISASVRSAFRLKPQDIPADRREDLGAYGITFLAGFEWLAFKIVIALFIIGLANSNPTFKELVQSVVR